MDEHVTVDRHTLYAIGWGLIELPSFPPAHTLDKAAWAYNVLAERKRIVSRCVAYAASQGWTLRFVHGSSLEPFYELEHPDFVPLVATLQACCRRVMAVEKDEGDG